MTTPQAQALADEAKRLVDEFGKAAIRCAKSATSANFDALVNAETRLNVEIDRLAALATQADTERANWKRWCELAEAATQAEAPACPDPAGCLREGCNQNGDGSLCERYVEPEAPAAPAQGQKVEAWLKYFPGQARPEVMPAQTFLAEDAIAMGWRPLVFGDALAAAPAQQAPVVQPLTDAARDVLAERQRQIVTEGWTPAHDDQHRPGQLASAAACYVLNAATWMRHGSGVSTENYAAMSPINWTNWPWVEDWWKPKSERRDLVRAAALILAEIERLDRAHGIGTQQQQESGK